MTIVYRDMDQRALDFQYDNRAHVADPQRYLDWYAIQSDSARARVRHVRNIAYGPLPDERLDIFSPPDTQIGAARPVIVFVHGGAWQHLDLARSSFAAEAVTSRGAVYVALGFTRMPQAGSLDEMVAQVRTALAWLRTNISTYGGNPERMYLIGHSSGAHLSAMALCTDWRQCFGLPNDIIRAAGLISGIYDLEPVRLSFRNDVLRLERADEIRNSPCRVLPANGVPLLIAYGELETNEFKRQARDFAAAWQRRFANCRLLELKGLNHYETIETFIDQQSTLSEAIFELFGM